MKRSIRATTFDEEQLNQIIEDVDLRFTDGDTVGGGTPGDPGEKLHNKVRWYRAHFHNTAAASPQLSEPFDQVHWQSDAPRRTWSKLKSRITENDAKTSVKPAKDTAAQRGPADDLEAVFNAGQALARERTRIDLQSAMADGQIIDGFAVLHWRKADQKWPKTKPYEYREKLGDDDDPKRYKKGRYLRDKAGNYYDETQEGTLTSVEDGYRQTDEDWQEGRKHDQAEAGWPWREEVADGLNCRWVEDVSEEGGLAMMIDIREIGLLSYAKEVAEEAGLSYADEKVYVSLNEVDSKVPIERERDAPRPEQPSYAGLHDGQRVAIACIWTRKEYYELVSEALVSYAAQQWKLVRSFPHPYEMVPYVIVPAGEVNSSDPALRYEPALVGVFRQKSQVDRNTSLWLAAGEQNMLPWYYWASVKTGAAFRGEDGEKLVFQRNSALAEMAPEGFKLEMVPPAQINPAYEAGRSLMHEEMEKSAPDTGQSEVSAGSQPWAIRLRQAEAAVEPGRLVKNQSLALSVMRRNQALVMSKSAEDGGFGEPVWVYRRSDDGTIDSGTIVGVEPEQIRSLDVRVDIDPVTIAERATLLQVGKEQMADPLVQLSQEEYVEDYEGKANAAELIIRRRAAAYVRDQVMPKLMAAQAAQMLGGTFILAPNLTTIDGTGQQVTPEDVLRQKGWTPQMAPQPAPTQALPPGAGMNGGGGGEAMPPLPTLAGPPEALPLGGIQ